MFHSVDTIIIIILSMGVFNIKCQELVGPLTLLSK